MPHIHSGIPILVGAQAVASALNLKNGRPKYANPSNQFIALVKGEYGQTPVAIDPAFREQITGSPQEIPYDTSNYKRQNNPKLAEFGDVLLAKDEKEELLLELFPAVASSYLKTVREQEFKAESKVVNNTIIEQVEAKQAKPKGKIMSSPLPGTISKVLVKEGDIINKEDTLLILESMKMENNIVSEYKGKVVNVLIKEGQVVAQGAALVEIGQA